MANCSCPKAFSIPANGTRYLENEQGTLVHTATVCYKVLDSSTLEILPPAPKPKPMLPATTA